MRYSAIDRARGIGIVIVVYVHLTGLISVPDPLPSFFSTFTLTLFPMLSGYLYSFRSPEKNFKRFLKKKLSSLLIPYFLFGITIILIEGFRSYSETMALGAAGADAQVAIPDIQELAIGNALKTILHILPAYVSLTGYGPEWFLPALFVSELLFYPIVLLLSERTESSRRDEGHEKTKKLEKSENSEKLSEGKVSESRNRKRLGWVLAALSMLISLFLQCYPDFGFFPLLGYLRPIITIAFIFSGFLTLGYLTLPFMARIPGKLRVIFFPLSVLLLIPIPVYCIPDFHHLHFGENPFLLFPVALLGSSALLDLGRIPDAALPFPSPVRNLVTLSGRAFSYFGRHSLLILCTHLDWYFIHIATFAYADLFYPSANLGMRYYFDMIIKLALVMVMEIGLISLSAKLCIVSAVRANRMGSDS